MEQKEVWNNIAGKWVKYREKPIPDVINFLKDKKGNILDLGCGSGRNFCKLNGKLFAVDFSEKMLEYAGKKAENLGINHKLFCLDITNLPFKKNFFDAAVFIATLHCVEGVGNRKKAVSELFRVLKPGANAMITVWSPLSNYKEDKIKWKINDKIYRRYYYFFNKKELLSLLKETGFEIVGCFDKTEKTHKKDLTYHKKNIVVIIKKPEHT